MNQTLTRGKPTKPLFIAPSVKIVFEESVESHWNEDLEKIDFYLNRLLDAYGMNEKSKKSVPRFKKTVRLA